MKKLDIVFILLESIQRYFACAAADDQSRSNVGAVHALLR